MRLASFLVCFCLYSFGLGGFGIESNLAKLFPSTPDSEVTQTPETLKALKSQRAAWESCSDASRRPDAQRVFRSTNLLSPEWVYKFRVWSLGNKGAWVGACGTGF